MEVGDNVVGGAAGAGDDGGGSTLSPTAPEYESRPRIDISHLECGVCMSLLCRPITISCGHSFCRLCLHQCLSRSNKKCPTCRAVCHMSAELANENTIIASIASTLFATEYQARLDETEEALAAAGVELPVFFYNDAKLPGGMIELCLFEPRYRTMMQRIVSGDRRFCYLPNFTDYSAGLGDVGLVAELVESENLSDGRWTLVAKMISRVKVEETWVEQGTRNLHYVRGHIFDDAAPADPAALVGLTDRMLGELDQLCVLEPEIEGIRHEMPPRNRPTELSFAFPMFISQSDKRAFLESTDVTFRMQKLLDLFTELRVGLEARNARRERARLAGAGNGDGGNEMIEASEDDAESEDDAHHNHSDAEDDDEGGGDDADDGSDDGMMPAYADDAPDEGGATEGGQAPGMGSSNPAAAEE